MLSVLRSPSWGQEVTAKNLPSDAVESLRAYFLLVKDFTPHSPRIKYVPVPWQKHQLGGWGMGQDTGLLLTVAVAEVKRTGY